MPLGEPAAVFTDDQRQVHVLWNLLGQSQRPIEHYLPRRRIQKIVAANDVRHTHRGIIDNDRKLIRRSAIRFGDDKIAQFARWITGDIIAVDGGSKL